MIVDNLFRLVRVRIVPLNNYKEYYITIDHNMATESALAKYLHSLEKGGLNVVRITCWGDKEMLRNVDPLLDGYALETLGHSVPSGNKSESFRVKIFAVSGKFDSFEVVRIGKKTVGTFFEVSGREHLYLSGLAADTPDAGMDFCEETDEIYKSIDTILLRYQFSSRHIYRFWNYMERITTNYAAFNHSRNTYFTKHKLTDYPVATGIEARLLYNQKINISLEAVKTKNTNEFVIKNVSSELQCNPCEYGPKFSRAKLLELKSDEAAKLYIAGTSSVNKCGKSILQENPKGNIRYVISCIRHLLQKARMSPKNIAMAVVYCKHEDVENAFKQIYKQSRFDFPYSSLITEICRGNLLFEMECIAVRQSGQEHADGDQ